MWDWLITPVDAARAYDVGSSVAWHARSMVFAWAIIAPLAVIIARFFKILPGQKWPQELDSVFWWRCHWIGQMLVLVLTILGIALVVSGDLSSIDLHSALGFSLLAGLVAQSLLGVARGSKGGPTAPAPDGSWHGHHYDMTPWRRMFEAVHKSLGYGLLAIAVATIVAGLWKANAPNWMWLVLSIWWLALIVVFVLLQRRGMAMDTYQAIWGDDIQHPGNRLPPPGWGVRRPGDQGIEDDEVRAARPERVRSS